MKVKVIGIQKIDYVSKKTNRHVVGINLHVCYSDTRTEGYSVDKFYLPADFPNVQKVKVNHEIEVYFNQFGKVDFLASCE